jgi:hypothetical protein
MVGWLVARLDESSKPPLPAQEQPGPEANRPGPYNYRPILVARDVLQCLKAPVEQSWPPEQADA